MVVKSYFLRKRRKNKSVKITYGLNRFNKNVKIY